MVSNRLMGRGPTVVNAQLKIRLPADVKAFIEKEASENSSSQSSEVVRAIRAAMKAKALAEPSGASPDPIR